MRKAMREASRATGQLARSVAMTFGLYLFATVLLITVIATLALVGAWMLPETVLLLRRIAGAKRRMVTSWTGRDIPEAYLPLTGTLRERFRTAVRDPGTFADLRWLGAQYLYGPLGLLTVPLWIIGIVVDGLWCGVLRREAVVLPLIPRLADLEARWSNSLLKPSPKARLTVRVQELTQTRAGAIAAHGAELRRIERDLHDGTQARLVSLSMRIGLAKRSFENDPEATRKMLDQAQDLAEEALTELRHVVRAIHPPILTDRGLVGAVRALAASSGLQVTFETQEMDERGPRAPAAVEAAAYFAIAEALTNAAKYSGSPRARIRLERVRGGLRAVVRDEGRGGADEAAGTGLFGIRRRVAALDGKVTVSSPVGGPTVMCVELPCVW
ncbi:histidine kinase [Streptomyces sp. NBC_01239]|uniref:sensor histidine kinase n=1 Tax=Streptomyces sp. NBC_01239 TaxID=2903792 RepID=UPI002251B368|nr:histidine kinase [Streptomyces sp. NBC_01239]MCX4815232.1 histidine kinase [Streptomyces sp. NBC_01239]